MKKLSLKHKILLISLGVCLLLIISELSLQLIDYVFNKNIVSQNSFDEPKQSSCRILCIGDSYTYGYGASPNQSYPVQMEKILNQDSTKKRFKVFNYGVPGHNSSQTLLMLKKNLTRIKPDIVIVMTSTNDHWNFESSFETEQYFTIRNFESFLFHIKTYKFLVIFFKNLKILVGGPKLMLKYGEPYMLIKLGNEYRNQHHFDKAKYCYQQALNLNAPELLTFLELARCYKLNKEYDNAAQSLAYAFKLNPANKQIHEELQDLFIRQKDFKKKFAFFSSLQKYYPKNKYIQTQISETFLYLEKHFSSSTLTQVIQSKIYRYPLDLNNRPEITIKNNTRLILNPDQNYLEQLKTSFIFSFNQQIKNGSAQNHEIIYNNLLEMVKICKKNETILIFSGYPMRTPLQVKKISNIYNIPLVEHPFMFYELLKNNTPDKYFYSKDNYHCTKDGYKIIAENIAKKILELYNNSAVNNDINS